MDYSYCVTKTNYIDENFVSYGIAAVCKDEGVLLVLRSAENLSCDYEEVREFVNLCNKLELDIIHFEDVVEDFLG